MKNLKHITTGQAIAMFENYKGLSASGVAFSSLSYLVDVAESKTVDGKKLLKKFVKLNATIGSDYEKKVNRIVENKQGEVINFVAQPQFGKEYYMDGSPVVRDTKTQTKRYLVFIVENHTKPSEHQLFITDGMKAVEKAEVWNEQYITPAGLKPKEYTSGRGAVDQENDFAFRTVDFDNLRGFAMGGTDYRIID
ncbi:MAG: hypothetical protein AABY15_06970 [Nanoarchaeota archaeon]